MCGIAGFIGGDGTSEERDALLGRMCRAMTHRGPDDEGRLVRDGAAIGMRRLSIIDVAGGRQPIHGCTQRFAIVFNGEIYNYREVKADLEARGHSFRTNSDTEVIVHAFEEFGQDCVVRLNGMFAFAVYDFEDRSLFIARDRTGEKPLFYSLIHTGEFVFGSELKVVLTHDKVERETDPAALDAFLTFGYVPEEFCIFKGIRKLEPGHCLKFADGRIETWRYWDFNPRAIVEMTEEDAVDELRTRLRKAVSMRLMSEVPLGAFLSGGVDSSSIVAMMSTMLDSPVKTFSIGFNEDSFDELRFARLTAKEFGTEHHEFTVTSDIVDEVDELVALFDEPFADSSALPTYTVSKLARQHVTVVLTGDGGDELFAGYTRYTGDRTRGVLGRLPAGLRKGVLRKFGEVLPHGAPGKNLLFNASLDGIDRYLDSVSAFGELKKRGLYADEFRSSLNGEIGAAARTFARIAHGSGADDELGDMLYLDSKTYLPSDILTKVDRMTMANSLEARVPLLDHELIEFVQTIPFALKMKGSETKHIFKKAMSGIVPDEILYRKKQGFGVPIGEWINARLKGRMTSTLLESKTTQRGLFNRKYVETLIGEHSRGRRDHSHQLWALWMLELWHRRYVDAR